MPTFTIDSDNNVTAYTTQEEATHAHASLPRFSSAKELAKLAAGWPADRLIEIWNSIPGNTKLTKLGPNGAARIWKALQPLAAANSEAPKPTKARKGGKTTKGAKAAKASQKAHVKSAGKSRKVASSPKGPKRSTAKRAPREGSKKAEIIALMQRAKGASLTEIQKLTGWQKHTVRGFISLLGSQAGLKVSSRKDDGERNYRIAR